MTKKETSIAIAKACRGALKELRAIKYNINYPGKYPKPYVLNVIEKHALKQGVNSGVIRLIMDNKINDER